MNYYIYSTHVATHRHKQYVKCLLDMARIVSQTLELPSPKVSFDTVDLTITKKE